MRTNDYGSMPRAKRREQLFDLVAAQVALRDVPYRGFGVYREATTLYYSKLRRNPKSKLHGFDSFEGLPENWIPTRPKGHPALQGQVPQIDDPRISIFSRLV